MVGEDREWNIQRAGLDFLNTTDERIPPYACMELDYYALSGKAACEYSEAIGDVLFRVKKPTSTAVDEPARVVVNGPIEVPANGYGRMQTNSTVQVLCDFSGEALVVGGSVGPKADSWMFSPDGTGFNFLSLDGAVAHEEGTDQQTVWVRALGGGGSVKHAITPSGGIAGKSGSSMGSAVCTLTIPSSSGVLANKSPAQTLRIYNPSRTAVAANTAIVYGIDEAGLPVVLVEDCGV